MLSFASVAIVASALAFAQARETDNAFVREAYGFRIERPDASWTFVPQEGGAEARGPEKFTLTINPPNGRAANFIVHVSVPAAPGDALAVREANVATLNAQHATEIERGTATIAGREAPLVRCNYPGIDGRRYQVAFHTLLENGYVYTLQTTVLAGAEPPESEFRHLLDSFALLPVRTSDSERRTQALRALADRCGSELEWAKDWKDASERAARDKKLVLVVYESYAGLEIPSTARSGAFMDPSLVALVRARFVPFEMKVSDAAPFRDESDFGMGAHSWGSAFLFATPAGQIVDETGISDAPYLFTFALDVLARNPKASGAPVDASLDRLARARAYLERGDLERAAEMLEKTTSVEGHRLRAALALRRQDGAKALEALADARARASEDEARELDADVAFVRLRMGEMLEAERAWSELVEEAPTSARASEAMYRLGEIETLRRGVEPPSAWWQRAVDEHPDDRWAWMAAANLLGTGAFVNGDQHLEWVAPEVIAAVRPVKPAPLPSSETRRAEEDAVRYLLERQQEDGSWIHPESFTIGTAGYTDATAAICGMALVPYAHRDDVAKAVDRALAFALEAHRTGRMQSGEGVLSVYSIWRQTFSMWFFARCAEAGIGDKKALLAAASEIASWIDSRQHPSGGWPYVYFPGDPEGTAFDPSASFLTAGVLLALLDARDAGAEVPSSAIDEARAFLVRLREEDGSFRYMPALPGAEAGGSSPEACGRGPVCALAVHRAGEKDLDGIRRAFELFAKDRPALLKVWGKELCHTGPQGQGSHYLFYDYAFAAIAARELAPAERKKEHALLLDDVLHARLEDGSFEDMPGLGRAYGTAMALMTFRALERD